MEQLFKINCYFVSESMNHVNLTLVDEEDSQDIVSSELFDENTTPTSIFVTFHEHLAFQVATNLILRLKNENMKEILGDYYEKGNVIVEVLNESNEKIFTSSLKK